MGKRTPANRTRNSRSSTKQSRRERRRATRETRRHRPRREARTLTRWNALGILALGLLVVGGYFPAFFAGFVWDDEIITEAVIQEWSGLWRIYFSPTDIEREGHYWPLVYTTFWLEHKLWGYDPIGYHVVNVLLHLVNTLLLWRLVARLTVPGAWLLAAAFAVHPLHVESVAWVIERKDVLSGMFYLAAFSAYIRFVAERRSRQPAAPHERVLVVAYIRFVAERRSRPYLLALALFALGLLCKSIVVTLPAALLIYHWWRHGRVTGADLLRLVPFFAVGLIAVVADTLFYQSIEPLDLGYSLLERVLIATHALWFYAGKLLWPVDLAVIYPHWDVNAADPWAWGYVATAFAVVIALYRFRHRIGRGPLAGVLFFAVTLSPVLGFVDFGYMQFSFVADRYQYLAGIGLMAVLVGAATYGVGRLPEIWRKGATAVAVVALVALGISDLSAGGHLPGRGDVLHPHRLAQSHGAGGIPKSRPRTARRTTPGRSAGRFSHRRRTRPGRCQGARQRRRRAHTLGAVRRGRGTVARCLGTGSATDGCLSELGGGPQTAGPIRRIARVLSHRDSDGSQKRPALCRHGRRPLSPKTIRRGPSKLQPRTRAGSDPKNSCGPCANPRWRFWDGPAMTERVVGRYGDEKKKTKIDGQDGAAGSPQTACGTFPICTRFISSATSSASRCSLPARSSSTPPPRRAP